MEYIRLIIVIISLMKSINVKIISPNFSLKDYNNQLAKGSQLKTSYKN